MVLSKLSPDPDKVEELATRMKEIIETTWLRDPGLNKDSAAEFQNIKMEIEEMGLTVRWETQLVFDQSSPLGFKLKADVNVWIPKNTTIH